MKATPLLCLVLTVVGGMTSPEEVLDDDTEFTNTWVAEIEGGEHVARRVARDLGYVYEGPVAPFDNHYVLTRDDHPEVSKRNSLHLTKSLTDLDEVKWAEQQAIVKRTKRGIVPEVSDFSGGVDYFPGDNANDGSLNIDSLQSEENTQHHVPKNDEDDLFALLFQDLNSPEEDVDDDPYSFLFNTWFSKPSGSSSSSFFSSSSSKPSSSWHGSSWSSPFSSWSSSQNSWSNSWSSSYGSSSSNSGSTGSKPSSGSSSSNSGSKPASSGSKPASSGSKPTSSGSKPASSGSKPASSSSSSSSGSNSYQSFLPAISANIEAGTQGDSTGLGKYRTTPHDSSNLLTYTGPTKHIGCVSTKKSAYANLFNDPLWTKQWYTQDYRTSDVPVMDHNVVPVYRQGITGKGVTVAVVDDGVEEHPDLEGNFVKSLSYDMCNNKEGSDPDPAYQGHANSHGTKCAGEIAMVANNSKCGVGIAYNAKIAGIKTLGKRAYDLVEARGLVHNLDQIDIYTNSWGPSDDGKTMEKMGSLVAKSILKAVTEGRKGKGAVVTFAAGNGRHSNDNCAADGFINNPYTIPIASASQHGKVVYYSERCTAVFAATYSGGNRYDEKVATIDLNGKCATDFSGTSAATPIATGLIALTLEANPNLTYRDVMHIITMTAEVAPVANNEDIWYKNGRGFWVSNDFGFGLMNAGNMVAAAKKWTNVPQKSTCVVSANLNEPQYFTVGENAQIQFKTSACRGTKDAVNYLEQIEVASTVDYPYRGALSITITSPSGTKSSLLDTRKEDSSRNGLKEWSIKSVHNWGEDPKGTWVIEVAANALEGVRASSGYVKGFTVTFHGTAQKPAHYNNHPVRKYAAFRLPDGKTSEV